jgi:hypothetical protein
MSKEVHVNFEVKSAAIMKKTLTELGHDFSENDETLSVGRSYHNIRINMKSSRISYDDMNKSEVDAIKQAYTVNVYKNEAIREGSSLREERMADGTVRLTTI